MDIPAKENEETASLDVVIEERVYKPGERVEGIVQIRFNEPKPAKEVRI